MTSLSSAKTPPPPSSKPPSEPKYADLSPDERVVYLAERRAALIEEYRVNPKPNSYTGALTGLENLGNTCYMSSILQCLFSCNPLTLFFFRSGWENDLNVATSPTKGRLACEYFTLLCKVWTQSNFKLAPTPLKLTVSKTNSMFEGSDQHDAHEFLVYLLDYLSEDLNKVILKPYIEIKEIGNQEINEYAEYCFKIHKQRNASFISDLFDGQTCFLSGCSDCGYKSIKCEPFQVLSVPIPTPETTKMNGYIHTLSGEYPIQEFAYMFDASYDINKIRSFIFKKNFEGKPEHFIPVWISSNRIDGRPEVPYSETPAEISQMKGKCLFFMQVYDATIMKAVFKERAKDIEDQLRSKPEFRMSIIAYIGSSQASVEREVVVPESVTLFEAYLLVYAIFRENFSKSGLKEVDRLSAVFPSTFEALSSEFNTVFNSKTKPLFTLKANGSPFKWNNTAVNLFDYCFEPFVKLEVSIEGDKFVNPLQLKKCYNVGNKTPEIADPKFTISQCFDWMIKNEQLDEGNQWICKNCQKAKKAHKLQRLRKLPKVLIIHLMRFTTEMKGYEPVFKKNMSLIDFPITSLDLSKYMLSEKQGVSTTYNLFAVSSHWGTVQKGHYKAYCWDTLKGYWKCCDDTSITKIEVNEIVTANAYLLFYERNDS